MRMPFSSRLVLLLIVTALGIPAMADAGTLTGHVRDQSAAPILGAAVDVLIPSTGAVVASGTTAALGAYTIGIPDGTYDVRVTPPVSSGLGPSTAVGISVSGTRTLDFALVSSSVARFSGRLLDAAGAGIPSQFLQLIPEGGEIGFFSITDAAGNYSFQVQPGSYFLVANGDNQSFTAQGPQFYSLQTVPFAITGSEIVDFRLPVKRVSVHVQDTGGRPVANAGLSSTNARNCELVFGPAAACGASNYAFDGSTSPSATTDSAGNVTLFLFATPSTAATSYTLTATPPASSGLAAGSASNLAIVADTPVTITLSPPTVLSGRLLDAAGVGIPSQSLQLIPDGQQSGFGTTTDANGGFSFPVQAGMYRLSVFGDNQGFTVQAPQSYALNSGPFALSTNQTIDFQLPVKRVDVHVQDAAGAAVPNAGLSTSIVSNCALPFGPTVACGVSDYAFSGSTSAGVTDEGGNVTLWLFPTPPPSPDPATVTTYRFTAIPTSGSGLVSTSVSGIEVTSNRVVTITLAAPVTLHGRLTGGNGAGVPFQFLEFAPEGFGGAVDVTTDATGNYSADVAAGTYHINAFGDNQAFTAAAPQFYSLSTGAFSVSGNQVVNLSLPVKHLDVHVQDSAGNPVANVGLSAFGPTNCELTFGPSTACGNSAFFYLRPAPGFPPPATGVTNAAGNLTLWLFPTPPPDPSGEGPPPAYNLTATPLADSGFEQASVAGVTLADNATLVIVLSAAHAAPVTSLGISPSANGDGTYPDPVTITLSATAAAGFFIDATFYVVDGGDVQQYLGPFQVSGAGPHVVQHFSSDSGGIVEVSKSFDFTIGDTTPPTTTATVAPPPNAAGWNNANVIVQLNAVDEAGGSGVKEIAFSISGAQTAAATTVSGDAAAVPITAEGVSIVTFFATDHAGNVEAAQAVTVKIDKTGPTITVAVPVSNAIYGLGAVVPVVASCGDALSGVASCAAPATLDTSSTGSKTLTVVATDRADNQTTKVVRYRVGGKDDCKQNGWRLFASPTFRNQGQCVSSFVPAKH